MTVSVNLLECPRCGHRFELSETFRAHYEQEKQTAVAAALRHANAKAEAAQAEREARIRQQAEAVARTQLDEATKRGEDLQAQLQQQQAAQEKREAEIRTEAATAAQARLAEATKRGEDLQAQLQESQAAQAANEAQIREEAQAREQNLLTQLQQEQAERAQQEALIRVDAEAKAEERYALRREQDAIEKQRLEQTVADLHRKLGQRSMELQGEAFEEYLKKHLQVAFPSDRIEDVKKGVSGADLIHTVVNVQGVCGVIVWEAKDAQRWDPKWIEKIKSDSERVGSQVRVIVSSKALPKGVRVFDLVEDVWVSSFDGARPLAMALRQHLVESSHQRRAAQDKGTKMERAYDFFTGPVFRDRMRRILETWEALNDQVNREEKAMQTQWKRRRKLIDQMLNTTQDIYTDFSAIIGSDLPVLEGLELNALLPAAEDDTIDKLSGPMAETSS